jgi:hypothetical protein
MVWEDRSFETSASTQGAAVGVLAFPHTGGSVHAPRSVTAVELLIVNALQLSSTRLHYHSKWPG